MSSTANHDPFALAALVGAGALVGHELGYLADANGGAGHDYFSLVGPFAIVGVIVAVWGSAVSVMRRGAGRSPSVAALSAAQSVLYVAFEVGERIVGGTDTSLFSLPVVLGLLAQPAVAWLAVRGLRFADAVVAALAPGTPLVAVAPRAALAIDVRSFTAQAVARSGTARAPPLFV